MMRLLNNEPVNSVQGIVNDAKTFVWKYAVCIQNTLCVNMKSNFIPLVSTYNIWNFCRVSVNVIKIGCQQLPNVYYIANIVICSCTSGLFLCWLGTFLPDPQSNANVLCKGEKSSSSRCLNCVFRFCVHQFYAYIFLPTMDLNYT